MDEQREIREQVKQLLGSQKYGVLATSYEGQPYTSLMAFAATADLGRLVVVTDRETRKYANLIADERVALLVDDRQNQVADVRETLAVTALGRAREATAEERELLHQLFVSKHLELQEFLRSPFSALIAIAVERYSVVSRFRQVREFVPGLVTGGAGHCRPLP